MDRSRGGVGAAVIPYGKVDGVSSDLCVCVLRVLLGGGVSSTELPEPFSHVVLGIVSKLDGKGSIPGRRVGSEVSDRFKTDGMDRSRG